ncbi:MAG: amidohydrolase family protein [Armatimonadetes bacterium]|nr:amidohydrolase family protein [Armatimonadota bacterium]
MLVYFDCNCEIGPRNDKDPVAPWSVDDVLRSMDHCGISGALVVHTLSLHNDPVDARERLKKEIAKAADRLFPVWTILPPDVGDFEKDPEDLLTAMAEDHVRAVKLCPSTHAYPLADAVMGPTLRALERDRTLTLIDYSELPDGTDGAFNALSDLLGGHPGLPVLLQRVGWHVQRVVTALMERHPNLHLEFSTYQINRGIEEYTKRFGTERLLFGTGLPAMSAGAARTYVDYAQIPQEAKEKIAGGNLSRLLGGQTPTAAGRPQDPLTDRVALGEPLGDAPVLDAHCHLLHEGGNAAGGYVMHRGDAEGMVELMDAIGIQKTAIMSWAGPIASDCVESNEIVARAVARFPDRFLGVVYLNPTHLSQEDLMAEVRRRVEEQGFVGLKPYVRLGLKYNDPLLALCWEYANDRGLYALLHTGGPAGGMEVVRDLSQHYPNVQWMIAHVGMSFAMARDVTAVMKDCPNVWAELTYTTVTNGVIEWMVSEVGDDRILFGSDAPMRDPRQQLGWVAWADLPLHSREKILGGNFQRMLSMQKDQELVRP